MTKKDLTSQRREFLRHGGNSIVLNTDQERQELRKGINIYPLVALRTFQWCAVKPVKEKFLE